MSRNKWYWTLQIIGWTLYGLLGVAINAYFFSTKGIVALYPFISAVLMFTGTHFVRHLIKSREWLKLKLARLLLYVFPIYILFGMVINVFNSWYLIHMVELFTIEEFSVPVFFLYVLQTTIYFTLWLGIYLAVHYFRNYKNEEIEKWKLQSAVKDAELIALKAQINPHFLFNALNNIRALILEDHMKARDMVSHLSELLRYSIQFNNNEKVTIAEELEIVNKYLELESIHYEKRLEYTIVNDSDISQVKIPPMIIQLMAENAVKHGISQVKKGGTIEIHLSHDDDSLTIEVTNSGKLKQTESNGIGIRNATERIRILFDKEPDFNLRQEGEMVKSTLKLPLQQ